MPLEMEEQHAVAAQVCWSCKVGKRKCSKELPSCARCAKLLMKCDYDYNPSDSHSKDKNSPSAASEDASLHPLETASRLMQALAEGPNGLHDLDATIPAQILGILVSNGESIPSVTSTYFRTIDVWLPIMSPTECMKKLETLSSSQNSDLASLLLSMLLVTRSPGASSNPVEMRSSLYFQTKTLHTLLMSSGRLSLEVLQAGLLISLYEIGHGITEAAQLTMAWCTRMATRIKAAQSSIANIQNTDFGRLWWGIVTLDRYMNQGLHADEIYLLIGSGTDGIPSMELPIDDEAHAKLPRPISQRTASGISAASQPTTRLGPFCRGAEAGHLLGKVLDLVSKSSYTREMGQAHCQELDKELLALAMVLMQQAIHGWEECCAAIGLCLSALLLLHERTWELLNSRGVQEDRLEATVLALSTATRIVLDISRRFHMDLAFINLPALPLPATYTVYRGAMLYIQFAGDDFMTPEWSSNMNSLKGTLEHFGKRWNVGKHYLEVIDTAMKNAESNRVHKNRS